MLIWLYDLTLKTKAKHLTFKTKDNYLSHESQVAKTNVYTKATNHSTHNKTIINKSSRNNKHLKPQLRHDTFSNTFWPRQGLDPQG